MSRPKMIGSRVIRPPQPLGSKNRARPLSRIPGPMAARLGTTRQRQSIAGGVSQCPTVAGAGKFPAPLRNDPNGSFSIGESPKIRRAPCPGNPRTGYRGFSEGAARNVGNRVRATLRRRARTFCQPSTVGLAASVAGQGTAYP